MAVAGFGGTALHAHDIALFPAVLEAGVQVVVKYGHPGDYQPAIAGKLVRLNAYTPSGEARELTGRARPDGADLVTSPLGSTPGERGTWVFAAFYDNGFFVKGADGRSVNTTRADYPAAAMDSSSHNMKFAKALLRVGGGRAGFDRVVGHRLELVPRSDPFTVAPGGQLPLEVRFDGKPLAGASVVIYGDTAPETQKPAVGTYLADANGIVHVPIARRGLQILSVEHGVPSRHPALATRDVYAASLVFTLGGQL
jgi:uncharacterized GH25 family protein